MQTSVMGVGGAQEMSLEAVLSGRRIIYLEGVIDDGAASSFARQVMQFILEDECAPIKVFINSAGGIFGAGMTIYDVIHTCGAPVELYCLQEAYSMAAAILACGKHGRYILPHGTVLIHGPCVPEKIGGMSSSIRALSESLTESKKRMDTFLAEHTGQPVEKVAAYTHEEHHFTAEEAISFGLVDGIMGFGDMLKER